jgi:hypothetical protein
MTTPPDAFRRSYSKDIIASNGRGWTPDVVAVK